MVAYHVLRLPTFACLATQSWCADRFRATGNYAWLIPWALTRPLGSAGLRGMVWAAGVDPERFGL